MTEISSASENQERGVDTVNKAIQIIDQHTRQTSQNAEESAATAHQLNTQAEGMKRIAETFVLSRNSNEVEAKERAPGHADSGAAFDFTAPPIISDGRRENRL
jgi:methyl-accepting chemotaxis protein